MSDVSLLAVGGYTYTSDLRLESRHEAGTRDWDLIIRNVSRGDGGSYECQVSRLVCPLTIESRESCQVSTTPHMSTIITLNVEGKQ